MAGPRGLGQLRASHADREQVIDTLKAAFVQGMLDRDEFDLRVGQTFASRTGAELAALTADLPVRPAVAQPPRPARTREEIMQRPGRMMAVATAAYAGVWAYGLFLSPHGGDNQLALALIFYGFFAYLSVLLVGVVNTVVLRRESAPAGSQRGGQHLARAVRHPRARRQRTRSGGFRRPVTAISTRPRQREPVVLGCPCRYAATAPQAPSRRGRLRQAADRSSESRPQSEISR